MCLTNDKTEDLSYGNNLVDEILSIGFYCSPWDAHLSLIFKIYVTDGDPTIADIKLGIRAIIDGAKTIIKQSHQCQKKHSLLLARFRVTSLYYEKVRNWQLFLKLLRAYADCFTLCLNLRHVLS